MSAQLAIDIDDPTPPYEQIRRGIASRISSGELPPDSRLPTIRQLAGDLGLAPGTVARAYKELEAAGYLVGRRGGGSRVATAPPQHDAVPLKQLAHRMISSARAAGFTDTAIREAVEDALHKGISGS